MPFCSAKVIWQDSGNQTVSTTAHEANVNVNLYAMVTNTNICQLLMCRTNSLFGPKQLQGHFPISIKHTAAILYVLGQCYINNEQYINNNT
jgi:hypothetical protein